MKDETLRWLEDSLGAEGLEDPKLLQSTINPILRPATLASQESLTELTVNAPSYPDFEVVRLLGEGGMGQVLLAKQRSLGRLVAIKALKPSRVSSSTQYALLQEARITGGLEHPNIVPLHLVSKDEGGLPLLVMKRVEGVSWKDLMQDPGDEFWSKDHNERLKQNLDILMQVCNAVHFAHKQNILHRDLKPANVMIGNFGEVYVLDWGVALPLDKDGTCTPVSLAGTIAYMAPEMLVRGSRLSVRTDVFLLGAILYEIIAGSAPNQGASLGEVLKSSLQSASRAYPKDAPVALRQICERAMHERPEERFESALAFRQELAAYLQRRSSLELAQAASEKLEELKRLLQQPPASPIEVYNVSAEARFGFEHAARSWQENPQVKEGLLALSEQMARFEILQRNPSAARAHLAKLSAPPLELLSQVEAIEQSIEKERAALEKLKAIEYQKDINISAAQRSVVMFAGSAAYVGGLLFFNWISPNGINSASPLLLFWLQLFFAVFVLWVAVLGRKFFMRNEANQQLYYATIVMTLALVATHTLGVFTDATAPQTFLFDLLLWGIFSGLLGVFLLRLFLWNALADLLLLLLGALWPNFSPWLLGFSFLLMTVSVTSMWRKPPKPA